MPSKKVVTLFFSIMLLLFVHSNNSSKEPNKEKVLDSKTSNSPSPTHVYTPSITPAITQQITIDESPSELYLVTKVVDGDTIVVSREGIRETIRLIGINTPESVDPRRPVECFAQEASSKAKEILANKYVHLKEDPSQGSRDKYNRLLRYVHTSEGLFFNHWMIKNGYAFEYTYDDPYKYANFFKSAEREAQRQKLGLWADETCPKNGQVESEINNNSPNTPQGVGDKDCKDFPTSQAAQEFYISQGGPNSDPHKLDIDKDGLVCESLP